MGQLHVELPEPDPARPGGDPAGRRRASSRSRSTGCTGRSPDQVVKADAKGAVERSADRYLKMIGGA